MSVKNKKLRKILDNLKSLVSKDLRKNYRINTDLRRTPPKCLLKLVDIQKTKVIHFTLTLRQMKSVKTSEFQKLHNFHLWVNPVCLVKSWSKWISWSDLFVLFKRHLSTNLSHFLFVSDQKNVVSLLFFRSFYTSPQKLGEEEISLTLDPGGFDSWDNMKTFLLALFLSV